MHITSLHIDRFGAWSDLSLTGFAQGLNVIYGPNGSGKTTLVHFIRSMLYGFGDEMGQRYLAAAPLGGGTLTVQGTFGRQTIARHAGGDPLGHLVVAGEDGTGLRSESLPGLLGGVRPAVFDRVFTVGFAGPVEIDHLIDSAIAHGFEMIGGDGDAQQLRTLQQQLGAKRQALAALTAPDGPLPELHARRRTLQQDLQILETRHRDHRATLDRRLSKLAGDIAGLEERLEQLTNELAATESELAAREAERREQQETLHETRLQRERLRAGRHERLDEIDAQLERWQRVLHDIELRTSRLLDEAGSASAVNDARDAEPRHFLRLLEARLDDLQKAVGESERFADEDTCRCRELRALLGPALQAMRDDVYRLCNHLSLWEAAAHRQDYATEGGQLKRCEAELRQAIEGLTHRRQTLWTEVAGDAATVGVALDRLHGAHCRCEAHPAQVPPAAPAETIVLDHGALAALDAEIQRLTDRRQEFQEEITVLRGDLQPLRDEHQELLDTQTGEFDPDRLESKQRELRRLDLRIRDAEQRRQLEAAIVQLEAAVRTLEAAVRHPVILREASEYLTQLTRGELGHMTIGADRLLSVRMRDGQRRACRQLSSGGRDQVSLSLCLALVAAYKREGAALPLILSDAFLNIDSQGAQAAAKVLRDFAERGHQVLLFTRHEPIAALFRSLNVPVRTLPSPHAAVVVPAAPTIEKDLSEVNRRLNEIAAETDTPAPVVRRQAWSSEEFPGELTDRVRVRKAAPEPAALQAEDAAEYFLSESNPIQDAPSIDAATAERFRKIGVLLVRDLLRIDSEDAAEKLRYTGISAGMIERWRAEALLVCRVPRLRPYDARILVACGVMEPDQLARLEAEELRRRVESFAGTTLGRVMLQAGSSYELSRLTDWISSARRQRRTRPASRETQQAFDRDRTRSHEPPRRLADRTADRTADRPAEAHAARGRRESAAGERPRRGRAEPSPVVLKMDQSDDPWRFHLEATDFVEKAPSIGPRMAGHLAQVGIVSVSDFLNADAAALVQRLGLRRMTVETIRQWQQQATLACRIPQLRGHDAQILVACGITDPDQLARLDAESVWPKVAAFVQTPEGRRVLRNGAEPDLAEVRQWIYWAGHARTLKAA